MSIVIVCIIFWSMAGTNVTAALARQHTKQSWDKMLKDMALSQKALFFFAAGPFIWLVLITMFVAQIYE